MPNAKVLENKQAIVAALAEKMSSSASGVLVDYKGINVADDTALRAQLRAAGVEYTVVKNTLTLRAAKQIGLDGLEDVLNGTTAMAVHPTDAVLCAKMISDYAKKNPKFVVKAGFVDGKVLSADGVKALASLPPKEVLLAQVLGTMLAPVSGLATVLNANIQGLAIALNQIAEKKSA